MAWVKGLAALQLLVLLVGTLSCNTRAFLGGEEAMAADVRNPLPLPLGHHVAVEGVIYCKPCKLAGYNKYLHASPLPGAVARFECPNVSLEATTDKNGYFFLQAPKVMSSYNLHKCKVYLVSSPLPFCNRPSKFNGGVKGAKLKYEKIISDGTNDYALYTVGYLQFVPAHHEWCPK